MILVKCVVAELGVSFRFLQGYWVDFMQLCLAFVCWFLSVLKTLYLVTTEIFCWNSMTVSLACFCKFRQLKRCGKLATVVNSLLAVVGLMMGRVKIVLF